MKSLIITPLLITQLAFACGSNKETGTTPAAQTETTAPAATSTIDSSSPAMTTTNEEVSKAGDKYRFIISFISIGEGTDQKAKEMMDRNLKNWKDKTGKELEVESVIWGREGEVDYCFQLKELNEKQQVEFVQEMKKTFEGKDLVQITENEPCVHKR